MSKNVIIVECESTSLNYIRDLQKLGYKPIILEMHEMIRDFPGEKHYTIYGAKQPKRLVTCERYAETLEKVKKCRPLCIISGADHGLELALRLSQDLKLVNNDFNNLPRLRDKYQCQLALKEAGLRYIESESFTNMENALKFFKKHHNKVVVKPKSGVSTIGVSVCRSEPDLKKALARAQEHNSVLTNSKPFLQELIEGDEFVVNTCSYKGVHKVTSCFYYKKRLITKPVKTFIYDTQTYISPTHKTMKPIVKYALEVLKAVNFQYGLCHSEFKVDKKGPVLIEINCRAAGSTTPYMFLDRILGHHETNLGLRPFLFPNQFAKIPNIVKPISNGIIKTLIIPKEIKIKKMTIKKALKGLSSWVFVKTGYHVTQGTQTIPVTVDLDSTPAFIFMENKDKKQLQRDLKYIEDLEKNHLDKLFEIVK